MFSEYKRVHPTFKFFAPVIRTNITNAKVNLSVCLSVTLSQNVDPMSVPKLNLYNIQPLYNFVSKLNLTIQLSCDQINA